MRSMIPLLPNFSAKARSHGKTLVTPLSHVTRHADPRAIPLVMTAILTTAAGPGHSYPFGLRGHCAAHAVTEQGTAAVVVGGGLVSTRRVGGAGRGPGACHAGDQG